MQSSLDLPGHRGSLVSPSLSPLATARIHLVALGLALACCAPEGRASAASAKGLLPNHADLRDAMAQWGLTPRTQGRRPTCSVFTMTGAIEFAVARREGDVPRLSVEFLNWAGNQAANHEEDGGFFSDLWKGFEAHGVCPESECPYQAQFQAGWSPSPGALAEADHLRSIGLRINWIKDWDVKTGLADSQLADIKRTLSRGWPVCGGFRWPKQAKWEDGVLHMCEADAVFDGHSVLLVGYRDDASQPGGGVLLFRNTSGDGRDGGMPYAYAKAYMNDAAWVDAKSEAGQVSAPQTSSAAFRGPLGILASPLSGRNRRISSNEQPRWNNDNLDMRMIAPGESLDLPPLEGPGVITHIWMTSHAGRAGELDALTLRIYWDGDPNPGVEAPLGQFFAVGQGRPAVVESFPVQVSPSGALTCYWRMPFAKSARIVIVNDNPDRAAGLYWQVDWTQLDALPPGSPYFHAQYRQEYPAVLGRDYLIADLRGHGQYLGTVLSVTLGQDGWWGEGDDFFYIDGEAVPSLQGTGGEDYFNDAWGMRPRTSHWFGAPRWQGDNAGDSGVCYRWHVLDPVTFTNSLKVTIEHKGNHPEDLEGFYVERPDFINSVAFWYQTGEAKEFGELPGYPERRVPWEYHHLLRDFKSARTTGKARVTVETSGMFGARPVLGWTNTEPGARLTLPFSLAMAGKYAMRLTASAAPGQGRYAVMIDGRTAVESANFDSTEDQELDLALGTHELDPGDHTLMFEALPCAEGKARPMAVEMLRLLRLPPEASRKIKNRNEAHFVRLGIGRAVYAYRLAYGELPDSLETLVKASLLPARYLRDENNIPLESRRVGDALEVESTGPGKWKHSWQGLDARR